MNLTDENLIKIEKYLNDKLSIVEKEAFEIEINQSEEIKEYIEIHQQVNQFKDEEDWVEYDGDIYNIKKAAQLFQQKDVHDFSKKLKSIRQKQKPGKKLRQWKKLWIANGLVACFLIFIFISYFQQPSLDRIYNNHNSWNELPSLSVKGTTINDQLNKLERLFKKQKFEECRQLCLTIINDAKVIKPNVLIYLGISQLELNEFDAALKTFTSLTKSNTIDFHKGYWYKAMVYLKKEEKTLLISELKQIKTHEYYNHKEAITILKKLKAN